jgi:hypothetical protein
MAYYDNPAGRLHDLLARLRESPESNSVISAWADVLGVEQDKVVVHLGPVADLVRLIQNAADRSGEQALLAPVGRYRTAWARPIFPVDQAFDAPLRKVLPDGAAMEALDTVSALLHATAPDGVVPGEEELEARKAELRNLIDEVEVATEIPDELKHLLIDRLRDVEQAIEHLNVGGPGAVKRAMEAAMGSLFTMPQTGQAAAKSPTVRKMVTTLWVIWAIFSAGQAVHQSIEGWAETVQMVTAGPQDSSGEGSPPTPPVSNGSDGATVAP